MRENHQSWQQILARGFRSSAELLSYLGLAVDTAHPMAELSFKTRVPIGFADRMKRGDLSDPLLRQVLATEEETLLREGYVEDPLVEQARNPIPGLIHKYHGRVLLTVTGSCAINCRYCFRRHFPYEANNPGRSGWQPVIDYISAQKEIEEVIFSGGDPLLASDQTLQGLIERLEAVPHLKTLRIHTRIPVVLPERVDESLLDILSKTRFQVVIVLHVNHPQELDDQILQVCSNLKKANCHLLNQSVLLAGVNDQSDILIKLSKKLFQFQVLPYYLHLLDKVSGTGHFDLPLDRAKTIYHQMQNQLPGYLLPRMSCEIPGKRSKILIT